MKKLSRKPKKGEIYKEGDDWYLMPNKYSHDPIPFNDVLRAQGNPGIKSDGTVDLWYFRGISADHEYWNEGLEEDEEPYVPSHVVEDFGRYFPTQRAAIKDANKWDSAKAVGLKNIPVDALKQDGKYKRSMVFKSVGGYSTSAPGRDVTPGEQPSPEASSAEGCSPASSAISSSTSSSMGANRPATSY